MLPNFNKYKSELLFLPLGGTNEIGLNVNLYHYQGKWLMVDCGSGFADALPGVTMLLPDLQFIVQRKEDLVGLFITHAHEDHIGAVPYLLQELNCPVYATSFPANVLKLKLSEYEYKVTPEIVLLEKDSSIKIGPFEIDTLSLTHSSPEMQALVIKTPKGKVLHTGDWKLDPGPVVGPTSNLDRIKQAQADGGILALVCDSTNAFSRGRSPSEEALQESLVEIIGKAQGLVLVTTFASNLARLQSLLVAASKLGKKVILSGKSLHRMFKAAQMSGYLADPPELVDEEAYQSYSRKELLVIATGCQGEAQAATKRIVDSLHTIRLMPGDTVIFSSKIIPGNEKPIAYLMNKLAKANVKVITEREGFVHTSGHPCQDELREMYELAKPLISIPVHGEPCHIYKHAELAKSFGVGKIIKVENGTLVRLDKANPEILGKVHNGYLAIDGSSVLPINADVLRERKLISDSGAVVITIMIDNKKGQLRYPPILSAPGCLDPKLDKELIKEISSKICKLGETETEIAKLTRQYVRKTIRSRLRKSPLVIVNVARFS